MIGAYTSTFDDAESIQIQQKIFHPLYPDPFNFFAYNIMILKLQHSSASPILKLRRDPVGQGRFTTIGLGAVTTHYGTTTTSQNSVFADKLQEIELGYVDRDQCQEKHGWYISDDMLCASEPMKDACTGDGGSPLLVKGDSYEDDELVGTVSV